MLTVLPRLSAAARLLQFFLSFLAAALLLGFGFSPPPAPGIYLFHWIQIELVDFFLTAATVEYFNRIDGLALALFGGSIGIGQIAFKGLFSPFRLIFSPN